MASRAMLALWLAMNPSTLLPLKLRLLLKSVKPLMPLPSLLCRHRLPLVKLLMPLPWASTNLPSSN